MECSMNTKLIYANPGNGFALKDFFPFMIHLIDIVTSNMNFLT